jgi:hypothetical protein
MTTPDRRSNRSFRCRHVLVVHFDWRRFLSTVPILFFFFQETRRCQALHHHHHYHPLAPSATTMRLLRSTSSGSTPTKVLLAETVWRTAAVAHRTAVLELLQPGLVVVVVDDQQQQQQPTNEPCRILDRQNPIYNFLVDYYGFKGAKGVKRLLRWSPGGPSSSIATTTVLQGAQESDFAETLPLRGLTSYEPTTTASTDGVGGGGGGTATYHPVSLQHAAAVPFVRYRQVLHQTLSAEPVMFCYGLHEWAMQYDKYSIDNDDDDHDHNDDGKDGSTSTNSASGDHEHDDAVVVRHYQPHLPRRVSAKIIRETVERRGVHCTHVDAIKYFTKDALPLNMYPISVSNRSHEQLQWEQPACVHAHMDLLQYATRLQPFLDAKLFRNILALCLDARRLDVAASPYDATSYGLIPVPIETSEGRTLYRKRQTELMERAQPLRQQLLDQYDCFIEAAFAPHDIENARQQVLQRQQS